MKKVSLLHSARTYLRESSFYVALAVALFFFSSIVAFAQPGSFEFLNDLLRGLIDKTDGLGPIQLIWFILSNNASSAFFALFAGMLFAIIPFSNILLNGALLGYVISKASAVTSFSEVIFRLIPHGIFELPAIFIAVGLGIKLGLTFFHTFFAFYKKDRKMRIKGSWIISLTFISFLLFFASSQTLSSKNGTVSFVLSFLLLVFCAFWFLFMLFGHPKLRIAQFNTFKYRLISSFYVFLTVILPLLIVAAIIEGILISFL